jgi:two-component sensor histidine kinase
MPITSRPTVLDLLRLLAYNTAIAAFLTALSQYDWWHNFIYSQAIGIGIHLGLTASCRLRGRQRPDWSDVLVGLPIGASLGFVLGTWANGHALEVVFREHPGGVLMAAATALVFGAIAAFYALSRERLRDAEAQAREERLRRTEQEAATGRTELRLLQAQIEPHFLFNTLSTVVSLIDTDPAAARGMLLDLTALLRTSLARTRRPAVRLGEELDLLRAYLAIMARRMGPRLSWRIDADPAVIMSQVPPLLVQPLVENALRHGLEPKTAGGTLTLVCRRDGARIEIVVADDGVGLGATPATGNSGVGLDNVRQRLHALFGDDASLSLEANPGGGVIARLNLPDQTDHDAAAPPADR